MDQISGTAELTFDDGTVFKGKASLFPAPSGDNELTGNFRSTECFEIMKQVGIPILSIGTTRYRALLLCSRFPDLLGIETIGPVIDDAVTVDLDLPAETQESR